VDGIKIVSILKKKVIIQYILQYKKVQNVETYL